MFYRSNIKLALALTVCASLVQSGLFGGLTGARAQAQQQTPKQPATQTPQPSPKPTPTPKAEDDVTLQDGDVVRVETDLTNILFTASDKQKRFITNLHQEDVRVTEDGQPQEIFTFARQTDLPLSLAILIDTSISEERTLPEEKAAASAFVDAVIRPEKDEAAVVSFTGEATLEQGLTSSIPRIRRGLESVRFEPPAGYIGNGTVIGGGTPPISGSSRAGSTAIWDAIWSTSEELLSNTSDKTRRAIILITDGEDTSSRQKMNAAIDRAVKADTVIYSIGYGDLYLGGINEGALRKISETTGGRAFFPRDESDLRAAFAQIQQELRSQYLVAYSPTNKTRDGSFRRVQVEIINPELRKQSLRLTYRQGYFAKSK
jgi:Ca-activated chloride channel family protein